MVIPCREIGHFNGYPVPGSQCLHQMEWLACQHMEYSVLTPTLAKFNPKASLLIVNYYAKVFYIKSIELFYSSGSIV